MDNELFWGSIAGILTILGMVSFTIAIIGKSWFWLAVGGVQVLLIIIVFWKTGGKNGNN